MASAVDICNLALANLGDTANVTSINPPEGSAQAERCAQYYPIALATVLEQHEWGFATKREALAAHRDNDRENWGFCYSLPSTCIKIIELTNHPFPQIPPEFAKRNYDYEIGINNKKQKCLYTNLENAFIRYISSVDESFFPASFVMAVSWKLASMLAGPILKGAEGANMTTHCEKMYMLWLNNAANLDASQHKEMPESIPNWIARR